ncbi:MAG: hypothetical protein FJ125_02615 [Deltaproteobacteria bacterium]|nr:hypothetical protein [Deltaproteobacteria bacterium]
MDDGGKQKKDGRAKEWLREALVRRQPTPQGSNLTPAPEEGWDGLLSPPSPSAKPGRGTDRQQGGGGVTRQGEVRGQKPRQGDDSPPGCVVVSDEEDPEFAPAGAGGPASPERTRRPTSRPVHHDEALDEVEEVATEITTVAPPSPEEPAHRANSDPWAQGRPHTPPDGWSAEDIWPEPVEVAPGSGLGPPQPTAADFAGFFPDLHQTIPLPLVNLRQVHAGMGQAQRPAERRISPLPLRRPTPEPVRGPTPPPRVITPAPGPRGLPPPSGPAAGGAWSKGLPLEDTPTQQRSHFPSRSPELVQVVPWPGPGGAGVRAHADAELDDFFEDEDAGELYEPAGQYTALQHAGQLVQPPMAPAYAEAELAEWEDQPTALYQGKASTQPPPLETVRRTTTSQAMVRHPSVGGLEGYHELLGGPLVARRHVAAADLPELHLVPSLFAPDSLVANQYRLLGQKLEEAASIDFCRTAAITSASEKDGKTTTALNLALILTEEPNRRIGLIDCNLRCPSLARMLSLPDEGGLVGVYRRELTLAEALVKVDDRELYVLPAGEPFANPTEILRSPLLIAIVRKMEAELSLVVIDTPSILPSADVSLLSRLVDRFIVVVRAGHTRRERLAEALRRLDESKVLGLVLNGEEDA